jgi:AraC family transcriptional regulator of adaptative response / DNA-3-methyladenine glycosylase II
MDHLDPDTCYQAISRRDSRFDGRFYTAVTSTGIFCRPSCPARTPKRANVVFYPHAAAASAAGFRPCRRCRPELAPGHPEWNRRSDLTGKALSLIESGLVERAGVTGLASELGVSERHLRRELRATVGTGPLQLARSRRLWLARLLLDQTDLSVTDVAFASGFGSLRQFNDSIRRAFGATPTELRRRPGNPADPSTVTLQLPTRGPLRWGSLHRFLAARAIPGLEEADGHRFRRHLPGGWIELAPTAPGGPVGDSGSGTDLWVTCSLERLSDLADLLPRLRRVADLDTDLDTVDDHLTTDSELARRLAISPVPRLPGAFDEFELAVRAVIGQQVSVAAARTLLGRLVALTTGSDPGPIGSPIGNGRGAGSGLDPEPKAARFPTPAEVAAAPLDRLGIPASRRTTLSALARAVDDGTVPLGPHVDPGQAEAALRTVPGIGPWTAGYVRMRALSDPDGWPPGDLGLRRSLGLTPPELESRAERWRPWRAYAALLLWHTDPTTTPSTPTSPTDPGSPTTLATAITAGNG